MKVFEISTTAYMICMLFGIELFDVAMTLSADSEKEAEVLFHQRIRKDKCFICLGEPLTIKEVHYEDDFCKNE